PGMHTPTCTVTLSRSGPGAGSGCGSCVLTQTSPGVASCHLTYTPAGPSTGRSDAITADYDGDATHDKSSGNTSVAVTSPTTPPLDCSKVGPSVRLSWPPNHKFQLVSLTGGGSSSITV